MDEQQIENKLTKMIMGQEYDTESANMIFDEEDIDWKVMNIKMTIDKTGTQHPSWVYTPLYTKDCIPLTLPISTGIGDVGEITVEPHPIDIPTDTGGDYETISIDEEFDVELGDWKCDEAFRLVFDPTGKIHPFIEFLVGNDQADQVTPPPETVVVTPNSDPEEPSPDPDTPVTDPEKPSDEIDTPSPVELPKQPDEIIGQTFSEERFPPLNLSTEATFILPDIHQFGRDLGGFIKDELIDIDMLQVLTTNGVINWWSDIKGCCKLFPLWALRNEASLLHAVNFVMSGFNNHINPLQNSMYDMFCNPLINKSIKQRWSYELWIQQSKIGKPVCSSDELEKRWEHVTQGNWFDYLSTATKSESQIIRTKGSNIEPIHIYMLANLICRPIIILAEVENDNNALTGIYLPFEQEVENCCRYPIILGYHHFHFSALVNCDIKTNTLANINSPICIPMTDAYLSLIPVHFVTYPGAEWSPFEVMDPMQIPEITDEMIIDELVKYLQLVRVRFSKQTYDPPTEHEDTELSPSDNENEESKHYNYLTAVQTNNKKPNDYWEMVKNYAIGAKKRHKTMKKNKVKCKGTGCKNIPSSQLRGVCVQCYQRALLNHIEKKENGV